MQWLVVEEESGGLENIALDGVESISCDEKGTTYVMRKGLPPKGFLAAAVYVSDTPVFAPTRSRSASANDHAASNADDPFDVADDY